MNLVTYDPKYCNNQAYKMISLLKKSLFFFEEFSYISSFTVDRYSQYDPLPLFDVSTWGQIHNLAGRGLITGWPSTQPGSDSEETVDTCVWPENGLLVDIETTGTQSKPQVRCRKCSGILYIKYIVDWFSLTTCQLIQGYFMPRS